ncbi:AI-2E family transporter [Candidatus Peregrinibacteria bacterium]|nr:AI-2E family transporter [Candidatus Peregrinibacteria bacterium]
MKNTANSEHPFSWKALMRILFMSLAIILAWKAGDALVSILIAIVMAVSIHPIVTFVNKKTGIPVIISIFLVLLLLLVPFIIIGVSFVPLLIKQFPDLVNAINSGVTHLPYVPESWRNFDLTQFLQAHSSSLLASTQTVASSIFNVITIIIMTVYFVYESDKLFDLMLKISPPHDRTYLRKMILEVGNVTGKYIRGNVLISIICGVVIYIGLAIMDIPFALPLAIFAAILDLLPIVGQTIGSIPALIIAFSISPLKGFLVLALHLAYQISENAFISPAIYNKVLDLYPAIIIVSVIIGGSLFGILGAFLALPAAAAIPVIIRYNRSYEKRHETN